MITEILIFLAVMVALIIYLNWRETSGFLWACIYVLIVAPLENLIPSYFVYAIFASAAGIGIVFECLHHFEKDPFSDIAFYKLFGKALNGFKYVLSIFGLRPKTAIINYQYTDVVQQAIGYLRNKDWVELESYLQQLEPNDRYRVIDSVVDVDDRPKALDQWLEALPHSALAHIVSGEHYIHWAWVARGGGVASTVSAADGDLFYERLSRGEAHLMRAIELDDQFAEPYVGLMIIAMGTGFERRQIWQYYAKALVRCENLYAAHSAMISAVAEKWGGEEGEMHAVAAKVAARAKNGSALVGIVAEAHIEQWLYLLMCEEEEAAASYFRQQSVRDDLRAGYEKLADTGPDTAAHVQALNNYAVCFYLAELNSLAKEAITKLDGNFVSAPWDYLSEPFIAHVDTAYAIDHVLKKLGIVTTDLPDLPSHKAQNAGKFSPVDASPVDDIDASIDYNRRVFKTPIIVPLSVLMVVVIYFGYAVIKFNGNDLGVFEGFKSYALTTFILCEIGLIGLVLTNRKFLINFLTRFPAIHNQESMDALKVIARTGMFSALIMFFFLGVGSLTAIMVILDGGWLQKLIVLAMTFYASFMCSTYSSYEKRVKEIECLDENFADELESVLNCWFHKTFPNF